jgi:hypothetical protein
MILLTINYQTVKPILQNHFINSASQKAEETGSSLHRARADAGDQMSLEEDVDAEHG